MDVDKTDGDGDDDEDGTVRWKIDKQGVNRWNLTQRQETSRGLQTPHPSGSRELR